MIDASKVSINGTISYHTSDQMHEHSSMDQLLLDKLYDVIENNLQNEQFSVEELARESGLSQSQLNRKLKAFTGKSANQLIREHRLMKALELLQANNATAAEVSYLVGFGSPSYFNTCFHDYYGYPPGEVKFRKLATSKKRPLIPYKVIILTLGVFILILLLYSVLVHIPANISKLNKEKSIAVLQFKNLSSNPDNQYLADGVRKSILNHLMRIDDLSLRSSISAEKYRDLKKDASQIGKELEVNYIVEGSFQKVGNQANLIVQLIDTDTDELLWTEEYNKDWSDIFAIQKEVAMMIAEALDINLSKEAKEAMDVILTNNTAALELFTMGMGFYNNWRTDENINKLKESINHFKKAIELDQNFSYAYTGLGRVYSLLAINEDKLKMVKFWEMARTNLEKAISIDPHNGWAHAELGEILDQWNWDSTSARNNFDISLKLEPYNLASYNVYFNHELQLGNCNKLEWLIKEMSRYGQPAINLPYHHNKLKLLQCQNKYYEIAAFGNKYWNKTRHLAYAKIFFVGYINIRNYEKANQILGYIKEKSKQKWIPMKYYGQLQARQGNRALALAAIDSLKVLSSKEYFSNVVYAGIYATLGEKDLMYEHLDKALSNRQSEIHSIYVHPEFIPYQNEARFKEIWGKAWTPVRRAIE